MLQCWVCHKKVPLGHIKESFARPKNSSRAMSISGKLNLVIFLPRGPFFQGYESLNHYKELMHVERAAWHGLVLSPSKEPENIRLLI